MRHPARTPLTLTAAEIKALLDGSSRADDDLRDHLLFSVALGTGLRVSEITALDVRDVANGKGAKGVWTLRAECTKGGRGGTIALPDKLRRKVSRFLKWKVEHGEPVTPDAPLFVSRGGGRAGKAGGGRLSVRAVQHLFETWQRRCGFRPATPVPCSQAFLRDEPVAAESRPSTGAGGLPSCVQFDYINLRAPGRGRRAGERAATSLLSPPT